MPDSSEILLARARAGDAAALAELLERHLGALRGWMRLHASPMLRRRESDSDLVQDVCLEALRSAPGFNFRGEDRFRSWLFTAAVRKLVERDRYWRAQQREAGRTHMLEDAIALPERGRESPSEVLIGAETEARIARCLDALPDEQREVILLSRFAGLSHGEIADLTGRSETAVRSALSRALVRVAKQLDR